jgi:hypothetical protein
MPGLLLAKLIVPDDLLILNPDGAEEYSPPGVQEKVMITAEPEVLQLLDELLL